MDRLLNFQMSKNLLFGKGAVHELPQTIRKVQCSKPLLVTDPGIVRAGLDTLLKGILSDAGISYTVYDQVEPDPPIHVALACLEMARKENCDMVVGLGGGSSLDIAKIVSMLMTNNGDISAFFGIDNVPKVGLPSIMIPTTSGTGSEVTPIAILSDKEEQLKKGIVSEKLYPTYAIVDPELTLSLPAHVTAYTGIDALTHAIEAYTNRFAHPFIDTFALEAIRLIGANLQEAVENGRNIDARLNMSLGSLYGGMCLGSVNTAAVHALAYPLGGTFNVPHGVANSLLLPYVMEVNLSSNYQKYANIALAMGKGDASLTVEENAALSIEAVKELSAATGIKSKMSQLDIPESAIEDMAVNAMKVTRLLNNNPKDLSLDDVRQIYINAY